MVSNILVKFNISIFVFMPVKPYDIIPPPIKSGNTYHFETTSGVEYEVRFARKADNFLHIAMAFGVLNEEYDGEEYSLTNRGEVYQVMATVVSVIKLYLSEHPNIRLFEYTAEPTEGEKDGTTNKRIKLYQRYIGKIFDESWSVNTSGNKMVIFK